MRLFQFQFVITVGITKLKVLRIVTMEIETRMMDAAQIVSKKMAFIVMEFQVLVWLSVWTESLQEMKLVKTMTLILQMVVQVHAKQFQDGVVIKLFQYQVVPLHVEMVFEIP